MSLEVPGRHELSVSNAHNYSGLSLKVCNANVQCVISTVGVVKCLEKICCSEFLIQTISEAVEIRLFARLKISHDNGPPPT